MESREASLEKPETLVQTHAVPDHVDTVEGFTAMDEAALQELLERLEALTEEDLCLSMPGFDIRCMQHEGLYSRIYMS